MALTKTKEVSGIFTLNIYRQLDIQIEYLEGKNTKRVSKEWIVYEKKNYI